MRNLHRREGWVILFAVCAIGCADDRPERSPSTQRQPISTASVDTQPGDGVRSPVAVVACSDELPAPAEIPGVVPDDLDLSAWIARLGQSGEVVLLSSEEVGDLNRAWSKGASAESNVEQPTESGTTPPLTRRVLVETAFDGLKSRCESSCRKEVAGVLSKLGVAVADPLEGPASIASFHVEMSGVDDALEKLRLVEAAMSRGAVVLLTRDTTLVYLGRNKSGVPMAVGGLPSYVTPCADDPAQWVDRPVRRREVVPLDLVVAKDGTTLLDQITHAVVLGPSTGPALAGIATLRPAAPVDVPRKKACRDRRGAKIYASPRWPSRKEPMRLIAVLSDDPGPVQMVLVDPRGERHVPELRRLGGPPFSYVATVPTPRSGKWTVVLGDGARTEACTRITVQKRPRLRKLARTDAVWRPTRQWGPNTENFYSAFVESLFDYPVEEDLTWPNLQEVLRNAENNLLFNYLGLHEERELDLEPDCADLPYVLRAYFSWKLGLPFTYRRCGSGWGGRPPRCKEEILTPLIEHEKITRVDAFDKFVSLVMRGVHSASARTHPRDQHTDYYPVALSREALRPGVTFADPYGHLLVIANWVPQTLDGYGVLVATDAQPDGTVGRRRFWRGSFLFTPDTSSVGAGFKAFRPARYDYKESVLKAYTNGQLRRSKKFSLFSEEQYKGTAQDFYERLESLINPRPLDPIEMQISLVDSLEEAVSRRGNSVVNGERYMAEHPGEIMEMPERAEIFQTRGPWEDYSTPSRDMRLLISLDTVIGFPDIVDRAPERFGSSAGAEGKDLARRVRERLDTELSARHFTYVASNGEERPFTLKDLVVRAERMEMAYNPNDCVEIRWGEAPQSEAMKMCARHAPDEQMDKMKEYRPWFRTRQRPVR